MGNSHKYENSKYSEAKLELYDLLDKGEKGRNGVLDFKNENGPFTGN